MVALIEEHRVNMVNLHHRYGVRTLDLFGSAIGRGFDIRRSDPDFIVKFADTEPQSAADPNNGRPVGLVMHKVGWQSIFSAGSGWESFKLVCGVSRAPACSIFFGPPFGCSRLRFIEVAEAKAFPSDRC